MIEQTDWYFPLEKELTKDYFSNLNLFLDKVYREDIIYPERHNVFKALEITNLSDVKVVILGQDPYHGPNQAQGLSFSVPDEIKAPPSLKNILKELCQDIGNRYHHDLSTWANQGVLLLNTILTVREHQPNAHANVIWEPFTDAIIRLINQKNSPVVFILWGAFARKKKSIITNPIHFIIESAHPSPLSAYRGFFGSHPFSKTNDFLKNNHMSAIDWLK